MATEAEKAVARRRAEAAERYRLNITAVDFEFEAEGWRPGRETVGQAESRLKAEFELALASFLTSCQEVRDGRTS